MPRITPAWRLDFANRLLKWYDRHQRDLPWRRRHDAYGVWISEVMLQQTQVETVKPYFERFLTRFPTIQDLAGAPEDEVLTLWSGLGYYSRARNLHAAAKTICNQHAGEFPRDYDAALALKGVGRYTAGAVLSIAYNRSFPVVDGNVERVLTRVLAERREVKSTPVQRRLWETAGELIPDGQASTFNQAIMELGALVCQPERPACEKCPIRTCCRARESGRPERYPQKKARRKTVPVDMAVLLVRRGRSYLMEWRDRAVDPKKTVARLPAYLLGVWNLPMAEVDDADSPPRALIEHVESARGTKLSAGEKLGTARHTVTYRRITLHVWTTAIDRQQSNNRLPVSTSRWRWAKAQQFGSELPVPSLTQKAIALANDQ